MFLYQCGKLYVDHDGEFVGVSVTPAGITLEDEKVEYDDGLILTMEEVRCKFGGEYTFPKVGDSTGKAKRIKKTT